MDYQTHINNMIFDVMNDNGADAQEKFHDIMTAKIAAAIDGKKAEVAQSFYRSEQEQAAE
jgi:hypothetical protein